MFEGPRFGRPYLTSGESTTLHPIAKDPTMPASEARILANKANATLSTGPRSADGRRRAAQNSLKHGLTGAGVVIHEQDRDEVEARNQALQAELAPQSAMGSILVRQMAVLSVRMERGAKQESAALASRVRHAEEAFDEDRVERADFFFQCLADDPRWALHQLRRMPEGVDRLIEAWSGLLADLTRVRPSWTASHYERATNLSGLLVEEAKGSRLDVLTRATRADFFGLAADEGAGLDEAGRRAWARARLVEWVEAAIAEQKEYRETLDHEAIEQDRAGATDVALFDPSREATLARRYESAARRDFFKALKELRRVEAEAADRPSTAEKLSPAPLEPALGSFRREGPPTTRDPLPNRHEVPTMPFRAPRPGSPNLEGGPREAEGLVETTVGPG
jgi:hypothetical protein